MAAKPKAWERRKGESDSAHAAFLAYRDLGGKRSLERLAESEEDAAPGGHQKGFETPSLNVLRKLCAKWDWVERCRAWDNHLQAKRDHEAAREAALWERRRQQELHDLYRVGQDLRAKAEEMLKYPLAQIHKTEGGKQTTINPMRWGMRDAVAAFDMAARLIATANEAAARDPADLTDAELEGIAEG